MHVMCWSSTLHRFIVITNDTIFTIDKNLMAIERCDLNQHANIYRNWRSDECIDDLCYKNGKLAIIIFHQPTNEIRLDLRSSTTLDLIWSIEIGRVVPRRTTGCSWLNNDE
ncbi:unnamed protein product [Rotaria magnacalcarata]|uniref:Uncharacterized protein n=2 Tax=Rotaria magnacalcarata TaxID=392030 RepID=A0A816R5H3_9BILA|nr:unnamed protein product [Rotaria magnacalcarata]